MMRRGDVKRVCEIGPYASEAFYTTQVSTVSSLAPSRAPLTLAATLHVPSEYMLSFPDCGSLK